MDGNTTVIITTEQIVPIPSNTPTVDMELWLEIKCITNPQTVNINPDENTVALPPLRTVPVLVSCRTIRGKTRSLWTSVCRSRLSRPSVYRL